MNIIKKLLFSSCVLFVLWFVISYLDIVIYNLDGGSDHMWNMFYVLLGGRS